MRYLFTLKWIFDLVAKLNKSYGNLIYKTKHFKSFSIIYKLCLILGILLCLILKYWKQTQIKNISEEKPKDINLEKENINYHPDDKNNDDDEFDPNYLNNLKHLSEERWKNIKNN